MDPIYHYRKAEEMLAEASRLVRDAPEEWDLAAYAAVLAPLQLVQAQMATAHALLAQVGTANFPAAYRPGLAEALRDDQYEVPR